MADVVYLRSYDDRTRVDDGLRAGCWMRQSICCGKCRTRTSPCGRSLNARAFLMARSARTSGERTRSSPRSHETLRAAPLVVDPGQCAQSRIAAQFSQLVMLLADEPGLAAACASALVCDEPSVRVSRQRIHAELRRRVRTALRSGAWPEVAETLEFGLTRRAGAGQLRVGDVQRERRRPGERGGRRATRRQLSRLTSRVLGCRPRPRRCDRHSVHGRFPRSVRAGETGTTMRIIVTGGNSGVGKATRWRRWPPRATAW